MANSEIEARIAAYETAFRMETSVTVKSRAVPEWET
jgi:hypothetical protein